MVPSTLSFRILRSLLGTLEQTFVDVPLPPYSSSLMGVKGRVFPRNPLSVGGDLTPDRRCPNLTSRRWVLCDSSSSWTLSTFYCHRYVHKPRVIQEQLTPNTKPQNIRKYVRVPGGPSFYLYCKPPTTRSTSIKVLVFSFTNKTIVI